MELPWEVMVPMDWFTAELAMAVFTCWAVREKYRSRLGSRRTWNCLEGAPSTVTLATPGTRCRLGTRLFCTKSATSRRGRSPPDMPNCSTASEFMLKDCTVGAVALVGSRRVRPATRAATWFTTASLFTPVSKEIDTRLWPTELVEFMSVMSLRVETWFSMSCVTCWSTTLGLAPG